MAEYDEQYDSDEAPPKYALTTSIQCSTLSKDDHVVIKGRPCKIVEIEFSEDEDGDTEIRLVAIDIFTGKKMKDHAPPSYKIDVPTITRTEYQFLYTDEDDYLHLLGNNETEKSDVFVPDNEVGKKIREHEKTGHDFMVTLISAMGQEHAISVRETS